MKNVEQLLIYSTQRRPVQLQESPGDRVRASTAVENPCARAARVHARMNSQIRGGQIASETHLLSMWFRVGQMMYTPSDHPPIKAARVYLRVSTDEQDLTRQSQIEQSARAAGYYIAGVYREKASGARADRPELLRMIADLQPDGGC